MQELYDLLVDDAEDLLDVIKGATMQQPFQLICQRLLHHLDDHQLLDFLSGILGQSHSQHQLQQLVSANSFGPISSPGGRAAWVTSQLEQCLQLIIFGCIRWRDLGSLTTHAALAFRFQQLHTSWQGSGKLQVLLQRIDMRCQACCIHAKVMHTCCFQLESSTGDACAHVLQSRLLHFLTSVSIRRPSAPCPDVSDQWQDAACSNTGRWQMTASMCSLLDWLWHAGHLQCSSVDLQRRGSSCALGTAEVQCTAFNQYYVSGYAAQLVGRAMYHTALVKQVC